MCGDSWRALVARDFQNTAATGIYPGVTEIGLIAHHERSAIDSEDWLGPHLTELFGGDICSQSRIEFLLSRVAQAVAQPPKFAGSNFRNSSRRLV